MRQVCKQAVSDFQTFSLLCPVTKTLNALVAYLPRILCFTFRLCFFSNLLVRMLRVYHQGVYAAATVLCFATLAIVAASAWYLTSKLTQPLEVMNVCCDKVAAQARAAAMHPNFHFHVSSYSHSQT
jgi:hypothetical protein